MCGVCGVYEVCEVCEVSYSLGYYPLSTNKEVSIFIIFFIFSHYEVHDYDDKWFCHYIDKIED